MKLDKFIDDTIEAVQKSGRLPAKIRFQINLEATPHGIVVVGHRITVDNRLFTEQNVAASEKFSLDLTIPVSLMA